MNSKQSDNLTSFSLGKHFHACAFLHSQRQEDKVVVPFIKEGFEHGQKSFCVSDCGKRAHVLQELFRAGINVTSAEKSGQLEVKKWEETYIREGRFDQESMLQLVEDVFIQGRKHGFAHTRFVGYMEWAITYRVGRDELLEYEMRLNHMIEKYHDLVVCVYDLAKFNPGMMMDILRTHPLVIIGELVAENPYYVPPEALLEELRERDEFTRQEIPRLFAHGH